MLVRRRRSTAASALERAHRELIARRLPLFALFWLSLSFLWRTVLVLDARLPLTLVVGSFAAQALILIAAIRLCRADPASPRVPWVAVGACIALAGVSAALFGVMRGSAEALAFALFTLGLSSAMMFAWGWRLAAGLLGGTLVAWTVAMPALHSFVSRDELALELGVGSLVWVVMAEAYARNFRQSWRQAESEREATRALAASRDAYRDLTDNASDLIYAHDLEGRFTYVNDAMARLVGEPADALIGRSGLDMIDPALPNPDLRAALAQVAAGCAVPPQLIAIRRSDGPRWLECAVSGIHGPDGRVVGVRGIARDVTERVTVEQALRASEARYRSLVEDLRRSEERLRRLARHQAMIREDERKRLGFDLHDDVCQELVGIGILVGSLRPDLPAASVPRLDRVERALAEVGEHLRLLARDLRPMLLCDLGLEESLHSLAEGMSTAETRVAAVFPTPIPRLDEETEIGVYRIAQEALANVTRHAGAHHVALRLAALGDVLRLEVTDDGRGFLAEDCRRSEALGLVSMEERALALGGRFEVRSRPGEGTVVFLECPLAVRAPATAA